MVGRSWIETLARIPADWDNSRWIVPLGSSGHPGSRQFADQTPLWARVELIPATYSWDRLEAEAESVQSLVPARSGLAAEVRRYEGSHQQFGVVIDHDVMLAMRDGTRLATDIYYPTTDGRRADGRFPVLLERTPYNKTSPSDVRAAKYFARRGYVCVFQDV